MRSWAWLLVLGAAFAACRQGDVPRAADGPQWLVLSQVPASRTTAGDQARWPAEGARVVVADAAHPAQPPRVLSVGFHVAGEAAVSHDGQRVCFVGRQAPADPWAIYTCTLEGAALERITTSAKPCSSPAWLPDGRIVYAARVDSSPRDQEAEPWALFVAPAGGGPGDRITFSGDVDTDPSVLSDGRIIYAGWRAGPAEDPAAGGTALFTVHPDGTGVALFHGDDESTDHRRPRQAPDGDVYSVRRMGAGPTRIAVSDWRAPLEAGRLLATPTDVACVEPAADGSLLVVKNERDPRGTSLLRIAPDGEVLAGPLFADPAWRIARAVEAVPRPRPQGHLSTIDPRKEHGSLLAIDTQADDVTGAATVRLRTWAREFDDEPATLHDLGRMPLAEDGSFFVRVPPDVPLVVELMDAAGRTLKASRTPFWVRPNEIRGCTGCHDPVDETPPNRRPAAVEDDPVFLRGDAEEGASR